MSGRKMVFGVSAAWLLMASRMGVSLVAMPLFYRHLPADLLGAWLLFASFGAFFSVSDFGLAQVTARALAWHKGLKEKKGRAQGLDSQVLRAKPQDLLATVRRAYALLGAAVFALGALLGWLYLGGLSLEPASLQAVRLAWLVYALGMALVLGASTPNYALQGLGDVGIESLCQAVILWLGLGVQVLLLKKGFSVMGMALVFLGQAALLRVVLSALLRARHGWLFREKGGFKAGLARALFRQGGPLFISSVAGLLIYHATPLLIAAVLGSKFIPDYNALVILAAMGMQVASSVPQALMPFAAGRSSAGDQAGLKRLHLRSLRLSLGTQFCYTAVLLAWAPQWCELWLGPGHFAGYAVLLPLCIFYLLEHHHVANATFSFSTGRWPFAPWSIAGGSLTLLFAWLGLRQAGLAGAAWGATLAQMLTNNWYVVWYTLKRLQVGLGHYARHLGLPLLVFAAYLLVLAKGLQLRGPAPLSALILLAFAAPAFWVLLGRRSA